MTQPLLETHLPLQNRRQGKVRDIYETQLGDGTPVVIIIASDRISAFDVVMKNGIAGKGVILTHISRFWFDMIAKHLPGQPRHHLISTDPADIPGLDDAQKKSLVGRVMVGQHARVVPIECVVRGYLAGSGWQEYQQNQQVCGVKLPAGLKQCDKLPGPIFTPATKAASGHDENISFEKACELEGETLITRMRDYSLAIYKMAHDHAAERGLILADTKFEFGLTEQGDLLLIDEVLTPDSSRYWPADRYQPGRDQDSFDKQYVRNYLLELVAKGQWHKTPPGPTLPDDIVANTMAKYRQAYEIITGQAAPA